MSGACQRCGLPAARPHGDPAACIGALGAALASLRADVEILRADLAARQAEDERARELRAEAEADLQRGG